MQEQLKTALALAAQGRNDEAEALLKSALAKNPASSPATGPVLYRLGIFAAKREDTGQAAEYFTRALAFAPAAPEILLSLAAIRLEQGDRAAARALAEKADSQTRSPATLYRLGMLYRQAGDMELAGGAFDRALALAPDYVPAYYGLGSSGGFGTGSPHFSRLEKLAESAARFSPEDRVAICFTLGQAYLKRGDDAKAFEKLAEGNALKKSLLLPFDAVRFDAYIESAMRLFDKTAAQKLSGISEAASDRPVFIIGMPRSGSTLADQILSSHPAAASLGESKFLRRCLPVYPNAEVPGLFSKGHPSITRAFMDNLLQNLGPAAAKYLSFSDGAGQGVRRLVDKMLFNFLWAGVIRLALPNAKIVHCTRDPLDIGLSLWQLTFASSMQWTYDMGDIARYYLAHQKLMAHWNAVFPGDIHEVNYETMVAQQEQETRKLVAACGLPWDDRCLDFHQSARMVKTSSAAQVRQPIYAGSAGKWRKYEKYLVPMISVL